MKKYLVIAILIISLALTGCASKTGQDISAWFTSTNTQARIITKGAVAEYLQHNKGSVNEVYQVTTDALTYVAGGTVTVEQLAAFVNKELQSSIIKLTPEGQLAAQELISLCESQLLKQLPANGVQNAGQVTLVMSTFLQWVNDVAVIYKNDALMR